MAIANYTLAAQAFFLIRARDIELAEDFYRRIDTNIDTIRELNAFFHFTLAQYDEDTHAIRSKLPDTDDFNVWATSFLQGVLPFLRMNRFPANTSRRINTYYNDVHSFKQTSYTAHCVG